MYKETNKAPTDQIFTEILWGARLWLKPTWQPSWTECRVPSSCSSRTSNPASAGKICTIQNICHASPRSSMPTLCTYICPGTGISQQILKEVLSNAKTKEIGYVAGCALFHVWDSQFLSFLFGHAGSLISWTAVHESCHHQYREQTSSICCHSHRCVWRNYHLFLHLKTSIKKHRYDMDLITRK